MYSLKMTVKCLICSFILFGSQLQAIAGASVVGIAAGLQQSLACQSDGTLYAWGTNEFGQLGIESLIGFDKYKNPVFSSESSVPVQILTNIGEFLTSPTTAFNGVVAVEAGATHGLLIKNGNVWGWGGNQFGQLGTGDQVGSRVPLEIAGLTSVDAIATGAYFSLALKNDGTIWSWGQNQQYELGRDTKNAEAAYSPGKVDTTSGLTSAVAIATGGFHALAIDNEGKLWAWGDNSDGQLGIGSAIPFAKVPQKVLNTNNQLDNVKEIAAGQNYSLALMADGTVYTWGGNKYGQLGDGTTDTRYYPEAISLQGVTTIAAGCLSYSSYALAGKQMYSWGSNSNGQLGLESTTNPNPNDSYNTPQEVTTPTTVTTVAVGADYFLAIQSDGTVLSCGANKFGQLGNGDTKDTGELGPIKQVEGPVSGVPAVGVSVKAIAAGKSSQLAIQTDGTLWGWGDNTDKQISGDEIGNYPYPINIDIKPHTAIAIAKGESHSLAITEDMTVLAWGANDKGQVGNNTYISSIFPPVQVKNAKGENLSSVIALAAGASHSLALTSDGNLWGWGDNSDNQLLNNVAKSLVALPLQSLESPGLEKIIAIAAAGNSCYALKSDGTILAWGDNASGQLGNGGQSGGSRPTQVQTLLGNNPATLKGVKSITAGSAQGGSFVLALINDEVWGWGSNAQSQLGNRNTAYPLLYANPVLGSEENPVTNVSAIAAGGYHSLAAMGDQTACAWGYNDSGQLGNNTKTQSGIPVTVVDANNKTLSGITTVTAGASYSCAFAKGKSSTVWAWGDNLNGQLGNGYNGYSLVAVGNVLTPIVDSLSSITPSSQEITSGNNFTFTYGSNIPEAQYIWGVSLGTDLSYSPGSSTPSDPTNPTTSDTTIEQTLVLGQKVTDKETAIYSITPVITSPLVPQNISGPPITLEVFVSPKTASFS